MNHTNPLLRIEQTASLTEEVMKNKGSEIIQLQPQLMRKHQELIQEIGQILEQMKREKPKMESAIMFVPKWLLGLEALLIKFGQIDTLQYI